MRVLIIMTSHVKTDTLFSIMSRVLHGVCLLLCFLPTCSPWALPSYEQLQFNRINIVNEPGKDLGIGPVNAVVQDQTGYMWFGGELGLVRYDAHTFVFHQADKNKSGSLSSSFIRDLAVDQKGTLWVATSQGLNRYIEEQDRFETVDDPSVSNEYLSSVVRELAVDSQNRLYAATLNGLIVIDQQADKIRRVSVDDGLLDNSVRSVLVDRQDNVWIGTVKGGLSRWDPEQETFRHWQHSPEQVDSLPFNAIETLVEDGDGNIWAGTYGGGIARLNPAENTFMVFRHDPDDPGSIGGNIVRKLFVDGQNRLWVGMDHKGLAVYDPVKNSFTHFTHSAYDSTSISADSVRSIYEDAAGDLWIGTFPDGINHVSRVKTVFQHLKHDPDDPNSLSHNGVLSLLQTRDGTIWIGTEGGLSAYHKPSRTFRHYRHDPGREGYLRSNAVVSLEEDENGDLWVGTWSGGLYRFDRESEYFEMYYPDFNRPGSLNSPFVWSVLNDSHNTLWVGTESGGLSRFDRSNEIFAAFLHDPADPHSLSFDYVRTLLEDSQGRFWVGTLDGLNRMDGDGHFVRFKHDPEDAQSLSGNRVISLFEDSRGRLWVGTEEDGLNVLEPGQTGFRRLGVEDGLPAPNIAGILEDDRGYIWVTTSNGVASVSPNRFDVQVFTVNDGISGNMHHREAVLKDDSGLLYLGSTEGVTIFDPNTLSNESVEPKVVINGLRILNRPVEIGGSDGVLTDALNATEQITLSYRDTMFSFDYSALSYHASALNQYAYKLEGFDKDWNYISGMRTATYTNIDPGNYVFRVKAANSNGLWNETGTSLKVAILPPPWQTWWAYILYGLAFLLLIALIVNFKVRRIELDKERRVNAKLMQLDKLKDAFLANTSHELRTPLNGIVGISESLMDGVYGRVSDRVQDKLRTIALSGRRLSALINDILDFSKMREHRIELHTQPLRLHEVVSLAFELVSPLANSKNIRLINSVSTQLPPIDADANRLQQILLNLIGNAIKYTPTDHGYVRVFAEQDKGWMKISVEDTGIGVPEENLEWIFDAFHQVSECEAQPSEGAGLGLAVSRQLVENHGGTLAVNSKVGNGSTFWFTLPISTQSLPQSEAGALSARKPAAAERVLPKGGMSGRAPTEDEEGFGNMALPKPVWVKGHTVLIVDDDAVNRVLLQGILSLHEYHVLEAKDGGEALRLLHRPQTRVDLVLLDVVMPGMNGFEVCEQIRREYPAHELPVVFLSANADDAEVSKGFACGANDFLAKPISKNQLLPRVENCLNQVRFINQLKDQLKEYMRDALQAEY